MSTQETVSGIMAAIAWMLVGACLTGLWKVKRAIKSPEKVLVEKVCVTANDQEYCKSFLE